MAGGPEHSRRQALKVGAAVATAVATQPARAFLGSGMSDTIKPFRLAIPPAALEDLKHRLDAVRWPDKQTVADGSQGAPLAKVQALVEYWRTQYDWRRCEARLNGLGQFRTTIDGLGIHFLHIRSRHANAMPLLMTHGWPGSVIEFVKVIGPLTDPVAHGGKAEDAFHLILPSLPGFGFSDKPSDTGWGLPRVARAWAELMRRLGYARWAAQGGDWGAGVATLLGEMRHAGLAGIHLNLPILFPPPLEGAPNVAEQAALADLTYFGDHLSGYAKEQGTRPQTLGYGLTDSPVGQAAWIYEKLAEWSDGAGVPESLFSLDEMLDNIMLYWLPATGTSSARLYWESFAKDFKRVKLDLPVGCSIFRGDNFRPPRVWAERTYSNLIYWNERDRGGHFAAFEQPRAFVEELRAWFAQLRRATA
jgi:pimeloyl-ACP methyl ester carboxylesterase